MRFSNNRLAANSRELRGASPDGNALLLSTEATIGVGSNVNVVLLGKALGVLGSSLSAR